MNETKENNTMTIEEDQENNGNCFHYQEWDRCLHYSNNHRELGYCPHYNNGKCELFPVYPKIFKDPRCVAIDTFRTKHPIKDRIPLMCALYGHEWGELIRDLDTGILYRECQRCKQTQVASIEEHSRHRVIKGKFLLEEWDGKTLISIIPNELSYPLAKELLDKRNETLLILHKGKGQLTIYQHDP